MNGNNKAEPLLCRRAYACRKENIYCQPALPIDEDNFYFVGSGDDDDCLYKKTYGSLYTCDCPVRQEIYRRYRI
jgi:hypothetical protein